MEEIKAVRLRHCKTWDSQNTRKLYIKLIGNGKLGKYICNNALF